MGITIPPSSCLISNPQLLLKTISIAPPMCIAVKCLTLVEEMEALKRHIMCIAGEFHHLRAMCWWLGCWHAPEHSFTKQRSPKTWVFVFGISTSKVFTNQLKNIYLKDLISLFTTN